MKYVQPHLLTKYKLKLHWDTFFCHSDWQRSKSPIRSSVGEVWCGGNSFITGGEINWKPTKGQYAIPIRITNVPPFWPSNFISRPLSYRYTHIYAKWCIYQIICHNTVQAEDQRLSKCPFKRDPDKARLFNCKKRMKDLQNVLIVEKKNQSIYDV